MRRSFQRKLAWLLVLVLLLTVGGMTPIASTEPVAYGDINEDTKVDAVDALLALQHSVSLVLLEGEAAGRANVNADSTIDAADALLILQYSVCLIDRFLAQDMPQGPTDPDPPVEPVTATIYFDTGVGSEVPPLTAEVGSVLQKPSDPTHPEHAFLGWLYNGEPYEFTTMPEQDLTLTALWEGQRKITFHTGVEGTTLPAVYAFPGEEISAPTATMEKESYNLAGWLLGDQRFTFGIMPDQDLELVADWVYQTNLPSLIIELRGEDGEAYPLDLVDRDNYIDATYTFCNMPDSEENRTIEGQFKGRGNGSWAAEKKGYAIKFDKKQSVFGRAKDKSWCIIACTNGNDETMMRNYLAYNMTNALFDNIEYCTTANWVDVYVNGLYHGVYVFCEKVKASSGRVDVESDDVAADAGFLVEYDAYAEGTEGINYFRIDANIKYPFTVKYPEYEDYMELEGSTDEGYRERIAYMQDYVGRVYNAALSQDYETLCELVDIDSFVDMYILHEYFKNADAGWSSFYMYKKPGEKLYLGPPWDFDGTASISGRGDAGATGIYVADTINQTSAHTASELYYQLYRTPEFFRAVQERWAELSPQIKKYMNDTFTTEFYNENKAAIGRNFVRWNGREQEAAESKWIQECEILKTWFLDRADWLDAEWAITETK